MKDYKDYLQYTVLQWLDDPDFLKWLKEPNSELNVVFTRLKKMEPEVAERMDEAQNLLFDMITVEPSLSADAVEKIWNNVQNATRKHKRVPFAKQLWRISAAAAVLLVVGISVLLFNRPVAELSYNDLSDRIILDSLQNITLKLGEHAEYSLSNKSEIIIGADNKIVVRTAKGDEISISGAELTKQQVGWLAVPKGKKASVRFADGSKATLRPGSKIVFPSEFSATERNVFVEGEAFLEVTKNKQKPFRVQTSKMEVEVLGTSFDVQAYPTQSQQSVILVTGLVNVRTTKDRTTQIIPNQKFTLNGKTNVENVNQVNVNDYISWKDDLLLFESEKLSTILNKLSSYYGVTFQYNATVLNQISLSGKLNLDDNIEDVMLVLAATANVKHETINTNIIKIDVKQ